MCLGRIFELPVEEESMLYDPQYIIPDTNGDMYVVDYGAYQILRFDSTGNYIMSYGRGAGRAPGEFLSISSVEVASDSLIYVTDSNSARISSSAKEHRSSGLYTFLSSRLPPSQSRNGHLPLIFQI